MRATGVGSMPGDDVREAMRIVLGEVGDLPFVPELPARGAPSAMLGRAGAVLHELAVDLQPAGWRLAPAPGMDQRRARSLLAQDLDVVEELAGTHRGPFKQQVAGPWTLAASVERPRGDKVLADHGARRELAESLAEGLADHVRDLRRRLPGADIVIQVDEPLLPRVLGGGVPTASGFSRHRTVHPPEADELLSKVASAISTAGARPVVHCCAADVPVALLAGAGFTALSFDVALAGPDDLWAETLESGVDLWPGAVSSLAPEPESAAHRRLERFFGRLGYDEASWADRAVVTPSCGLAGASPAWARQALTTSARIAEQPAQDD